MECCCKKNSFTVIASCGFTNLGTHLKESVPDFEAVDENRDLGIKDIRNHVAVDMVTQKIYLCVDLVITENLPL